MAQHLGVAIPPIPCSKDPILSDSKGIQEYQGKICNPFVVILYSAWTQAPPPEDYGSSFHPDDDNDDDDDDQTSLGR